MIFDISDASGMYSKAGRVSVEMFTLLQKKENILTSRQERLGRRSSSGPMSSYLSLEQKINKTRQDSDAEREQIIKNKLKMLEMSQNTEPKLKEKPDPAKQPFGKIISRDKIQKLMEDPTKKITQKTGSYNPRYNLIYRRSPFYEYDEEEKKKKNKKKMLERSKNNEAKHNLDKSGSQDNSLSYNMNEASFESVDKSSKKIRGFVSFDKQLKRKELLGNDVNENRFEYVKLPNIYSKIPRTPVVNFERGGRSSKYNNFINKKKVFLEYRPNYDTVLPNSKLLVMDFKKSIERKDPTKRPYTLNESSFNYDLVEENSIIGRKVNTPIFDKMMKRDFNNSVDSSLLSGIHASRSIDRPREKNSPSVNMNNILAPLF